MNRRTFSRTATATARAEQGIEERGTPVKEDALHIELGRRYHRKEKVRKLKRKLALAKTDGDREKILHKIRSLSPFWTPSETK